MAEKNQEQTQGSIIEEPDIIIDKAEEFFQNKKNKNITFIVSGIVILASIGYFLYSGQMESKNQEAYEEMFQAQNYYEIDSLDKALNGDGLNYGFLEIINDYSRTDAANLSNFYVGHIYMKLGSYDNAIEYLDDFSSSDYVLQARAYSLIGDSYMELNEYQEAIEYYEKAANYKPNESFTPVYLYKLAIAQEQVGNFTDASETYGIIMEEYFELPLSIEAKKHKTRLDVMSN